VVSFIAPWIGQQRIKEEANLERITARIGMMKIWVVKRPTAPDIGRPPRAWYDVESDCSCCKSTLYGSSVASSLPVLSELPVVVLKHADRRCATLTGIFEQHMWPPRDPDMDRPIRPLPNPTDNPFTYGSSFNPALQPSNSSLRSRSRTEHSEKGLASPPHPHEDRERTDQDIYSSGEDRDDYRSSPEPYLSDMDDSDDAPLRSGGENSTRGVRVRRGSEGYEVAAVGSWNWMDQLEEPREAP
jgi:hypothetical protein